MVLGTVEDTRGCQTEVPSPPSRIGYIISRAQCTMKMQDRAPYSKNVKMTTADH